jgi:tetratricopeptide (TPR) repeat protein
MSSKSIFGPLAAAILMLAGPAYAANADDWRHDLDTIMQNIETIHPNPFTKIDRARFEGEFAALKAAIPSLTEEQRVVRAMRIVALVGDGHTQLAPKRADFGFWYPMRLYEFTDGYFITTAYKTDPDLAGAQILKIAGQPVEKVIEDARSLMGDDTTTLRTESLFAFHNPMLMKGLGYAKADGTLPVTVRLKSGKVEERVLKPYPSSDLRYDIGDSQFDWRFNSEITGTPLGTTKEWTSAFRGLSAFVLRTADNTRPLSWTQRRSLVSRAAPERDAYFMQVNGMADAPNETFIGFFKRALAEVDKQRPKTLIIDVRYNGGGDGSLVPPTIHQFIQREASPPWKECYLLTGRKTFSAAVQLATAIIQDVHCSVVGEPAGAAYDSFGDETTIDLPRTGLEMIVSTVFHQLDDSGSHIKVIPVDVPATFSFADWEAGRDPAVDPILKGEEMRSIAHIAVDKGGAAARRIYHEREKRYGRYIDWLRPREVDVIHAGWPLLDLNRNADQLEISRLETEIFPHSARAWNKLGDSQSGNGHPGEALASYRRALELDPNNIDNLSQRQTLYNERVNIPAAIRWGASIAQMQKALTGKCSSANTRRIDPPFLDNVHDKQMQIDCEGFSFAGAPRHAEFVFGDDALKMVWVMTTEAEQNQLLNALGARFGSSTNRNVNYVAFEKNQTALRLDKAEVLFYAPELATAMAPNFAPPAAKP